MPSAATWLGLQTIRLSELRQRVTPHDTTYMWRLKYCTSEHIHKTEADSQAEGTGLWLPGGGGWGGVRKAGGLRLAEANHDIQDR